MIGAARFLASVAILAGLAPAALAQHQGHSGPDPANGAASPYAGFENREIRALSPEQIEDLRAGRGMGLALAAELNGYPGPVHLLELANPLALTADQRAAVEGLLAAMKAETIPLGEQAIAAEAELDRQFRDRSVTQASLTASVAKIADLQGDLRAAHLRYHLGTLDILTPEQAELYNTLRGYGGERPHEGHPG
jgi:Spy/CpxP family protein refolding chaperone